MPHGPAEAARPVQTEGTVNPVKDAREAAIY
jgi:hypothetical protein